MRVNPEHIINLAAWTFWAITTILVIPEYTK